MKKLALAAAAAVATASAPAFAVGPDLSSLTDAVDVTTIIPEMTAVGGVIALVLLARMGIKKVLGMIR